MAGLYVHIPFCAQACTYCDFHFTTKLGDRDAMVSALRQEMRSALANWKGERFTTAVFRRWHPQPARRHSLAELGQPPSTMPTGTSRSGRSKPTPKTSMGPRWMPF